MMDFTFYLGQNKVKKISKDFYLAKSLHDNIIKRAKEAVALKAEQFPTLLFESMYDAYRELCDALLALDGYKSYSHEASIVYLRKYKVPENLIMALDNFRYKRNSSKYYGKDILIEDVKEMLSFHKENFKRFLALVEKRLAEEGK